MEKEQRNSLITQCNTSIDAFKGINKVIENGINRLKNGPEKNEFNEYLFLYKTNSEEFDQHFYDATTEIERITVDRRRFREIDDDIEFIDF